MFEIEDALEKGTIMVIFSDAHKSNCGNRKKIDPGKIDFFMAWKHLSMKN